jgi:multicomponent K+:H+ antiporter subunit D
VASVGSILVALGLFGTAAWSAGLYYLLHSTLVVAALFLLAGVVAAQRGTAGDALSPGPPVAQPALLGGLLVLGAAAVAGLPPLPGFIGKLMLLQASGGQAAAVAVWSVVLVGGFFSLVGLARAGSVLFWGAHVDAPVGTARAGGRQLTAALGLLTGSVLLSVFAAPVQRYTAATAAQLMDKSAYARAVLPETGGEHARTTRPYRIPQPAGPSADLLPKDPP